MSEGLCGAQHPSAHAECTMALDHGGVLHIYHPTGLSWPVDAGVLERGHQETLAARSRSSGPPRRRPRPSTAALERMANRINGSTTQPTHPGSRMDGEKFHVALDLITRSGAEGMTYKEVDVTAGWDHHGVTSGLLSNLHRAGHLALLREKRGTCKIYVLPEHADGRETIAPGQGRG